MKKIDNQTINKLRKFKRIKFRSLLVEFIEREMETWWTLLKEDGVVLDVGGGGSNFRRFLPKNSRYINLDLKMSSSVCVVADASRMPIKNDTISTLLLTNILEHVQEPKKIIAEASRVLESGGTMIVVVPFLFKVHADPDDYWRFTDDGLRLLLEDYFEITEMKGVGGGFAVIWEVLTQRGISQIFRIFNKCLAFYRVHNDSYPLAYCLRAKPKN